MREHSVSCPANQAVLKSGYNSIRYVKYSGSFEMFCATQGAQRIQIKCDNLAVVQVLNSKRIGALVLVTVTEISG